MGSLTLLRQLGIIEGLSWLTLLFVAMPLKYIFDQPMAVRVVGSIHGLLFCVFVVALVWVYRARSWPIHRALLMLGAAVLPFGFFFVDRTLRDEADGARSSRTG